MKNGTVLSEAGSQYAKAYAAHYTARDLAVALQTYTKIVASYPGTREASNSRAQIQNIVNTVVPKQELMDAQVELALAHLGHEGLPDAGRTPAESMA